MMYSSGAFPMDEQRQDVQLESTYSSFVPIQYVAQSICRKQWTIGRRGERESTISVLIVRYDDEDLFAHIVCSIWPIIRNLSGATTPGLSGPGSHGNVGVLHIP